MGGVLQDSQHLATELDCEVSKKEEKHLLELHYPRMLLQLQRLGMILALSIFFLDRLEALGNAGDIVVGLNNIRQ